MASGWTSPPVLSPATGSSGPSAHPPSRARIVLSAVGLIFLAGVVTVAAVLEMRASRAVVSGEDDGRVNADPDCHSVTPNHEVKP